MKQIIYLVGQISTSAPETYNWRERFIQFWRNKFEDYNEFSSRLEIINPCFTEWNSDILEKNYRTEPTEPFKQYLMKETDVLPPKDRAFVQRSTIGIVNVNQYDPNKPLIGSYFELAWYYDSPDKTVIGICEGPRTHNINANHPFVRQTVNTWVENEIKACRLLERFFIG